MWRHKVLIEACFGGSTWVSVAAECKCGGSARKWRCTRWAQHWETYVRSRGETPPPESAFARHRLWHRQSTGGLRAPPPAPGGTGDSFDQGLGTLCPLTGTRHTHTFAASGGGQDGVGGHGRDTGSQTNKTLKRLDDMEKVKISERIYYIHVHV